MAGPKHVHYLEVPLYIEAISRAIMMQNCRGLPTDEGLNCLIVTFTKCRSRPFNVNNRGRDISHLSLGDKLRPPSSRVHLYSVLESAVAQPTQ